jgi:general secretion pathway protein K
LSRFLLPTFLCGRQRKVGAAPHRGNANRPLRNQGKAKNPDQGRPRIQIKKTPPPRGKQQP